MKPTMSLWGLVIGLCLVATPSVANSDIKESEDIERGRIVYERSCLVCHGSTGQGDGPAAFFNAAFSGPRARDFTVGNYRFRSTASGEAPLDQDLMRVITEGIPGTMPSFRGLSEQARWQVIAYLKQFNVEVAQANPVPVALPEQEVPDSAASVAKGREIYHELDCHSCHGVNGDGRGTSTKQLQDDRELRSRSSDLRYRTELKNGHEQRDIIRTLFTGLDGTPMPSYAAQLEGREEDAWHLANYILSLSAR